MNRIKQFGRWLNQTSAHPRDMSETKQAIHRIITTYNSTGQKHGLSQSWRKDGTKKDSIVYTNGDMTEVRTYYTDGSQRMWEKYKNDKLWSGVYHGPDGKKTGVVKKGNGECVLFGEDGKYASRRVYKNGVKVEEEWLEEE